MGFILPPLLRGLWQSLLALPIWKYLGKEALYFFAFNAWGMYVGFWCSVLLLALIFLSKVFEQTPEEEREWRLMKRWQQIQRILNLICISAIAIVIGTIFFWLTATATVSLLLFLVLMEFPKKPQSSHIGSEKTP